VSNRNPYSDTSNLPGASGIRPLRAERANARSRLVANCSSVGRFSLVGYDSLLPVVSELFVSLPGIHELVPGQLARIKPLQQDIRVPIALLRKRDRRIVR